MDFKRENMRLIPNQFRSSCSQIFYKIGVIKNFVSQEDTFARVTF